MTALQLSSPSPSQNSETTAASILDPALCLEGFHQYLCKKGKLLATVESYHRDARRFVQFLARHKLRLENVEPATLLDYQTYLADELLERVNSIRRTVIGVRQFYRYLAESRLVSSTPFDVVPIPARHEALAPPLDDDDMDRLIQVAAQGVPEIKGMRDASLVSLLAFEGLKASEVIALTTADLLFDQREASLRIKGGRARSITLGDETAKFIQRYRALRDQLQDHQSPDGKGRQRLFFAFKGREAAQHLPVMTRHGLKFILYELGAAIQKPHLNTELLRHHAVRHLIRIGKSPEEIQHHLGLRRLGNIARHIASMRITTAGREPILDADECP